MPPFPLNLNAVLGQSGAYLVYMLIGFGFGFVLEIAGFGYSPKLAAQFYFKDLTVLKVMFTAIVVAMVLVFASTAVGLLDFNLIWVPPTYLWPGIIGGLIMGVGFILGGFCPGTSLVAAVTAKLDGIFFVLGGLLGFFIFGETVDYFRTFWYSSYMGRFTIPEWLGLPVGVVVVGVVLMALFMFWGAEQLERIFGGKDPKQAPRWRYAAAGTLVAGAVAVMLIGQPTTADRWARLAATKQTQLQERSVQIHPAELLSILQDRLLRVAMLDVRQEADYNLFHIAGARNVSVDDLQDLTKEFQLAPPNTVYVVMSNDEGQATEAWKVLVANSVPNVYILEGGINNWLAHYATQEDGLVALPLDGNDALCYQFKAALGDRLPAADPDPHEFLFEFTPKVKLDLKRGPTKGGCG